LRFSDSSAVWDCPNAISLLPEDDFARLEMQDGSRRICFRPVITSPGDPVEIAFVGLASYCGHDYAEAVTQPNFTVWAQSRYNGKLVVVIEKYCSAIRTAGVGTGSAYFTNCVKVVLPQDQFAGASAVEEALTHSRRLDATSRKLLGQEIQHLIMQGCRAFVCFGNDALRHFRNAITGELQCTAHPIDSRVERFQIGSHSAYLVHEHHFSRYRIALTSSLAASLVKHLKRTVDPQSV
jgi:hypothetical protein